MNEAEAPESGQTPKRRWPLWIGLAAVVAAFLFGYVPATLRARHASEQLDAEKEKLAAADQALQKARFDGRVERLRGELGEIAQITDQNNFGLAASRATAFFDGLQAVVGSPELEPVSTRRTILQELLSRRDEISSDFAVADPAVKAKLAEMYMRFGQAVTP